MDRCKYTLELDFSESRKSAGEYKGLLTLTASDREVQEIVKKLERKQLERIAAVAIAEVMNDPLSLEIIKRVTCK